MMAILWKRWGREAVPIAYAELLYGSGVRDHRRAENPPVSYYYSKFYKVAPYYVKDRHTYTPE